MTRPKDYYQNLPKVDEVKNLLKTEQEAPKPVRADFVIEGAKVYYKGVHLPFNDFGKWLSVLGKESRRIGEHAYIWDDLGITCLLQNNALAVYKVWFRSLESLGLDAKNERDRELMETTPRNFYNKDIIIDGAVVNKDTRISGFNTNKKGQRFKRGYRENIYDYDITWGVDKSAYFQLHLNFKMEIVRFSIDNGE